jgi:hypothetical protein
MVADVGKQWGLSSAGRLLERVWNESNHNGQPVNVCQPRVGWDIIGQADTSHR